MDVALEALSANLLRTAGEMVRAVHSAAGFPVYLVRDWEGLRPDDALAWWTPTNLAVVRVSTAIEDPAHVERVVHGRLAVLEQHASGLPLRARTSERETLDISQAVVTTAALIRGARRVPATVTAEGYLSAEAIAHITALLVALRRGDRPSMMRPSERLAGLLIASGLRGPCSDDEARAIHKTWSKLGRAADAVASSRSPLAAVNAAWKWATNSPTRAPPPWILPTPRSVTVRRPRTKVLGTVVSGVLASDELNAKNFAFSPAQLGALAEFTCAKPFIYLDHDRSQPPAAIALDAMYHCHGEEGHHVSILAAALSARGDARLNSDGGFSAGFELVPARRKS